MATALVPGSFNPIHLGHVRMVEAVASCFDRVVVAPVGNPNKPPAPFSLDERRDLVAQALAHVPNVEVAVGTGLVVDLAREVGAVAIVKGLRGLADFESEVQMAHMNSHMTGVVTMFVPTAPELGHLSSSLIREIARLGGTVADMVPPPVVPALTRRLQEQSTS